MKNLVSKNPVQRFKQGRKIVKALGGVPMVINNQGGLPAVKTTVSGVPATRTTVGGVPSVTSKTTSAVSKVGRGLLGRAGSFLGRVAGPIGAYLIASDLEERRKEIADKLNSGEYTISNGKLVKNEAASGASIGANIVSNVFDSNRIARRRDYKQGEVTYHLNNGVWYAKWNDPKKPNQGYYRVAEGSTGYNRSGDHNVLKNGKWVKINETPKGKTSEAVSATPYTRNTGYNNQYGFAGDIQRNWRGTKGVIANDDLKLLQEMGFKGKTAQEAQDYMNSQFANNGLIGYKVASDNAWGGQSNEALQDLYKAWKEKQEIKPTTIEKPSSTIQLPQAPVMQRQAISDYSNYASNLKSALGNNNNFQGLSNLVWKEYADDDNSFAANFSRDMRSRFNNYKTLQEWLNNQQAIENALNISGKYRGSRSGDFGDIARSQASWAGGYNYNIDKQNQSALNNYNALINKYKRTVGGYKVGGQLPSRNVVKRFKQKNFR